MLKIDRLQFIESKIRTNGSVVVAKLSQELNVTEETIRRDLGELEESGRVVRVRGGAYLPDSIDKDVPIDIRESLFQEEKNMIATYAFEYIKERDSLFLDSSTTAVQLAALIKSSEIRATIITNSLKISNLFTNHKLVKLICLGGHLRTSTNSFVGQSALEYAKHFSADSCFISSSGIELGVGITDNNEKEALVRKQMLKQSKRRFLIIDHTKFSESAPYITASLEDVNYIITDKELTPEWDEYCLQMNTRVIVANME